MAAGVAGLFVVVQSVAQLELALGRGDSDNGAAQVGMGFLPLPHVRDRRKEVGVGDEGVRVWEEAEREGDPFRRLQLYY